MQSDDANNLVLLDFDLLQSQENSPEAKDTAALYQLLEEWKLEQLLPVLQSK